MFEVTNHRYWHGSLKAAIGAGAANWRFVRSADIGADCGE